MVTAPAVMVLVEFRHDLGSGLYGGIGYLAAWAIFLLTRWREIYAALSVLGEEIRYYLSD